MNRFFYYREGAQKAPSVLYKLLLFVLSRGMQRRGKAVNTMKEKEMNWKWNTKNNRIQLMQAKKKGKSVENSLIFGLQFTQISLHVNKWEGSVPEMNSGSVPRKHQ